MCNPLRLAARPTGCHAALVSLCDGRSAEVFFDFDAGSLGSRDRLGVTLEPDEGPSVELVDVQVLGVSIIETLTSDDQGFIVDQLLGVVRPAPSPIPGRRPSISFALEAQQMLALHRASGEAADAAVCDLLPFPLIPVLALPEPPRAA